MGYETVTKIADVVVPEVFDKYVSERTKEQSKLLRSGIAISSPILDKLVSQGGKLINMPYWKDLTGDDEVLSDSTALTPGKITADQDVAPLLMRGKAFGSNNLASALAGDDPTREIGDKFAAYRDRKEQKTLLSIMKGVFASSTMSSHILDRSAAVGTAANIDGQMVLDGKQLMGDAGDDLQAIMMHSATYTALQKQNLITTVIENGPSGSQIKIDKYLNKYNVVVDDGMPVATTVSTAGVYTLAITTAASAGDKIQIGATEYTFVANDSTATGNVIKIGADGTAAQQATNIAAKLNGESAGLKDSFTIAVANSTTVTFTNKLQVASEQPFLKVTKAADDGTLVATMSTTTPEALSNIYTSYLFALGAIGRGEGTPAGFVNSETDRDSLAGEDYIINRWAMVLHPFGVKWIGSSSGATPSNSELEVGTNWYRVYESKNVGLVAIKHKVA